MKIYADDGKEFKTVDECNAYEADIALKKAKEETERKAKEQMLKTLLEEINSDFKSINDKLKKYQELGGDSLGFYYHHNGDITVDKLVKHYNHSRFDDNLDDFFRNFRFRC